ncbi:MAG: hypothetical protein JWQ96_2252 [Segetibacter sp.]|nr:hypothetical protein [Segetibacter sp.]
MLVILQTKAISFLMLSTSGAYCLLLAKKCTNSTRVRRHQRIIVAILLATKSSLSFLNVY